MSNLPLTNEEIKNFHSEEELNYLKEFVQLGNDTLLPDGYNELFAGSGVCNKCHGYDTLGVASVDLLGNDVNLVDDWRATMMANSARDPFWLAKVSHEVIINPGHKVQLEDKCTSCHAPLGHFNSKFLGQEHYSIAEMLQDSLALDGVSCLACHQQSEEGIGILHSGNLNIDTAHVAYGPYPQPLTSPMFTETGYYPIQSNHISDAGLCAGCHTLVTETVDLAGELTGGTFVEQATYHEWLNSDYGEDNITCQNCHMPSLGKDLVFLVTGAMADPRTPYYLHDLVGANMMMLKLMKENAQTLNIPALPEHFDETLAKTEDLLKYKTLDIEIDTFGRTLDTLFVNVQLANKAGHKFPSGYPSRRAYIELTVTSENGDTLFISGKRDDDFEVFGHNVDYEPHYSIIRAEDEVQIYEMVMGDVNGDVTTVLERADAPIKDNRLPPAGFITDHEVYDTTLIAGLALSDEDFNKIDGIEGTGGDDVMYHIPMDSNQLALNITAKVYYQSAPPKWMKEMFAETSPEIEAFRAMFDAADRTPFLINEASMMLDFLNPVKEVTEEKQFAVYPNPSNDGVLFVQSKEIHHLKIFDLNGKLIKEFKNKLDIYSLNLNDLDGIYIFQFENKNGLIEIEKVIIQ